MTVLASHSHASRISGAGSCTDPAPHSGVEWLWSGGAVGVAEWHCRGHDAERRPTEIVGRSYDLVVARRGAYARETDGVRVLALPGVVTFWNPGQMSKVSHPVPGGDVCSVFRIPPAGVRALLATYDPRAADAELPTFPADDVTLDGPTFLAHRVAVAAAAARDRSREICALAAEEHAMCFLHAAIALAHARAHSVRTRTPGRSPAATNRRATEYVMRVREVVARRFREPLTLGAIAAEVDCSPYHLSRIVSAHDGVPIYRLVIRTRLRAALDRVLGTTDSLTAVALDAGFASQSHFGDAFRREFGHAPGVLRRAHRTGAPHAGRRAGAPRPPWLATPVAHERWRQRAEMMA